MERHSAALALIAALAWPSHAQDEGGRRGFVPRVQARNSVRQDEDNTQQAQQRTFLALLENYGDSLNHTVFPKNEVVGDVELFNETSQDYIIKYQGGLADSKQWALLTEAVHPAAKLLWQAYQKLVERAMMPLGGEAGPIIKELLERLQPLPDQNADAVRQLQDVSQQIDAQVAKFQQAPETAPDGVVNGDVLQPVLATTQQTRSQTEELKDKVRQANRKVNDAKGGIADPKNLAYAIREKVDKAGEIDNESLGKVSQNKAAVNSSGGNFSGRSKPVLEGALERLNACVEKGEKTQEAMSKLTDEDPQKGLLMKSVTQIEEALDKITAGAQAGLEGSQKINQFTKALAQLSAQYQQNQCPNPAVQDQCDQLKAQAQDLTRQGQEQQTKAQETSRAADESARGSGRTVKQLAARWKEIEEHMLGRLHGGKSELQSKLPLPLPDLLLKVQQAKESPSRPQTSAQRVRSKPITYPTALGMGTKQVRQAEGLDERGSTSRCSSGDCGGY